MEELHAELGRRGITVRVAGETHAIPGHDETAQRDAAEPAVARGLYELFVGEIRNLGFPVATGVFQAMMDVELTNQGPVTFILDSRKRF